MSNFRAFAALFLSLLSACASTHEAAHHAAPIAEGDARQVFERLKSLDGDWTGTSTKGWTETIRYQTIAAGSCVQESSFGAHPNESMVTLFHLDGPRLMLTHYCVAKNQPRLVATELAPDASTVTFTFLDATNLASRDKGHMDKVRFHFVGPDEFTSQWTWYQDGHESWMEEIVHRRSAPSAAPIRAPAGP